MSQIKPAEVSAILREQLAGNQSEADLQEVGTVLQVGDGIARIYGLSNVRLVSSSNLRTVSVASR